MAQYFNIVSDNNVPLMLEDGNQLYAGTDGQRFHLVFNNANANGNQNLIAYSQATEPAIISHPAFIQASPNQTFNSGQNVYIINTEDFQLQQNIIKTSTVSPQLQKDCTINFIRTSSGSVNNSPNEGVELQWVLNPNQTQKSTVVNIDQGSGTSSDKRTYTIPINSSKNSNSSDQVNFIGSRNSSGDQKFRLKSSVPSKPSPRPPIRQSVAGNNQPQLQQKQKQQHQHQQSLISTPQQKQKIQNQNQAVFTTQTSNKHSQYLNNSSEMKQKLVSERNNEFHQNRLQRGQVTPPRQVIQEIPSSPETDTTLTPEKMDTSNSDQEAGYAYLQKTIYNPSETIVQHQITGNVAKMLVVLPSGEQRLITFDVPNEECTVQDLLDQADIPFSNDTSISLVIHKKLNINYIVEIEGGVIKSEPSQSDVQDEMSDVSLSSSNTVDIEQQQQHQLLLQQKQQQKNQKHQTLAQEDQYSEESPKYIEGKLALCNYCGIGSVDFNRCYRCKKKIPEDVKQVSTKTHAQIQLHAQGQRGRGGVRSSSRNIKRPPKEPECLTLSSDEDEENENNNDGSLSKRLNNKVFSNNCIQSKNNNSGNINNNNNYNSSSNNNSGNINNSNSSNVNNNNNNNSNINNVNNIGDDEELDKIIDKEPIITNNPNSNTDYENSLDCGNEVIQSDDDNNSLQAFLQCRTVRIGSYKYAPTSNVELNRTGLILSVPYLEDSKKIVKVHVKMQNIIKCLIHYSKSMPVLFFYVNTKCAGQIREILSMQDSKGVYFDSAGKDQTHKRITLLPEKIPEEYKNIFKVIFHEDQLEELNNKEANDILLRASPKDNTQLQTMMTRKSTQLSTSTSASAGGNGGATTSNGRQNTETIVHKMAVYPPPPAKGGIAINTEDYACLAEDQFLNDVIIDFYLRYLMLEVLSESDRERTHVFSTYFYKRLTSRHAQAVDNLSLQTPAAKRHARVQKWTKNVNIFDKDFIIIPINEHAHWFLAIICFPGLVGSNNTTTESSLPSSSSSSSSKHQNIKKKKKTKNDVQLKSLTIGSTTITPVTTTITLEHDDEDSERDEAEGDEDEMDNESDEDDEENEENVDGVDSTSSTKTPINTEIIKTPCILIFDSLAGAGRSRVVATLRDYLGCEHVAKLGTEKTFSRDTMKGASPRVPQQSNFTDCGLYLLQYVEHFFKDPIKDFTLPIKSVKNWFEEIVVTRKREELSNLLLNLMPKKRKDDIQIPTLQFPTENGILKPKPETEKSEEGQKTKGENKKKIQTDDKVTISNNSVAQELTNADLSNSRAILKLVPASPNSIVSENNTIEIFPTNKPGGSAGTSIRNKRPPTVMKELINQDSLCAKKQKNL